MKESNSSIKNKLFILLGTISLITGIIGIVLPLLPTTPLLLLSAYFYSKGSQKLYNKLLNNKFFGKYIKDYRENKGITTQTKITSILSVWVGIGITFFYFTENNIVKTILVTIAISISFYLLSMKTKKPE